MESGKVSMRIEKFPQPRPAFKPTQSLQRVINLIENGTKIVHLHGMPGAGKSQILLGACKHFARQHQGQAIWHILSAPGVDNFISDMKSLTQRLGSCGSISQSDERLMTSALDLGQNGMKSFVDTIGRVSLSLPALIAVDGINLESEEHPLVKAFINALMEMERPNVQLLLATRQLEVFFTLTDLEEIETYSAVKIEGFTNLEAKEFLLQNTDTRESDDEIICKLAHGLRYSPLRLVVAKNFCRKFKVSYKEYYESLGKDESIIEKEKILMLEHPDLGEHHGYEVIMQLLMSKDEDGQERHSQFQVLKMISFISNYHIPSLLMEKFFEITTGEDATKCKSSVQSLRERLRKEVDAAELDQNDEIQLITLHEDVLRAINASMDQSEKQKILGDVVISLTTLLDKDNRMKKNYLLLHDLKIHLDSVARHAAENFEKIQNGVPIKMEDVQILLGLSRLNEMMGFAICQHPGFREGNEEDRYYHRALDCLWMVVCSHYAGKPFLPLWLTKQKTKKTAKRLIHYEEGKNVKKTAEEIYKMAKEASLQNSRINEALRKDKERVFLVKLEHIEGMRSKPGYNDEIGWDEIKQALSERGSLSEFQNESLVKHGMIIKWERLAQVYLIERLASILHSRGRQDNYKGDIISDETRKRCLWYTELGMELCEIGFKKSGIKSSFYYILKANNKLPRLAKNRDHESDAEFQERIQEARNTAMWVKNGDGEFYEHGIYKHISGTAFTVMNALKYLVKVNTKIHKRPEVCKAVDNQLENADAEAEELLKLASVNPRIMISPTCLVHTAKYFAARGDFAKALATFELAFSFGINANVQMNSTTYAWALYNFGRAIIAGGKQANTYDESLKRFIQRYENTKTNDTPIKWRHMLDECKSKVSQ